MPDQSYIIPGQVILANVTFTGTEGAAGSTFSWNNILAQDFDNTLNDVGADGVLVEGVDTFAGFRTFSGYTITGTDAVEYPVFVDSSGSESSYYVPIPVDGSVQTQILSTGSSNVYQSPESDAFLCFAPATAISTPKGARAVEDLAIGDQILTAEGAPVSVKWVGRQTLLKLFSGPRTQPIRIRADALGDGLPHSDLTVTADHGMIVDGLVINASALVNGGSIDWVPMAELPDRVTYYHIETEAHDVILANGAPAETFVDVAGRMAFDNYAEYVELYGVERIIPEMDRPRISSARLLPDAIKVRLGIEMASGDIAFLQTA